MLRFYAIGAVIQPVEHFFNLRMTQGLAAQIRHEVLFRYVSDIFGFRVFSEQMIKGLIAMRTRFLGNGFIPFFRIREFRIYVEDDPTEGEQPVLDDLTDLKFRVLYLCHTHATLFSSLRDKLKSAGTGNSVSLMSLVIRKSA